MAHRRISKVCMKRNISPTLVWCWTDVADVGPTVNQRGLNVWHRKLIDLQPGLVCTVQTGLVLLPWQPDWDAPRHLVPGRQVSNKNHLVPHLLAASLHDYNDGPFLSYGSPCPSFARCISSRLEWWTLSILWITLSLIWSLHLFTTTMMDPFYPMDHLVPRLIAASLHDYNDGPFLSYESPCPSFAGCISSRLQWWTLSILWITLSLIWSLHLFTTRMMDPFYPMILY